MSPKNFTKPGGASCPLALLALVALPCLHGLAVEPRNPPTCVNSGAATVLLTEWWDVNGNGIIDPGDQPVTALTKFIGQPLLIQVGLQQSGAAQCAFQGGTLILVTPDAVSHTVATGAQIPLICGDPSCSPAGVPLLQFDPVAYTVRAADLNRFPADCPTDNILSAAHYRSGILECGGVCPAQGDSGACSFVEHPVLTCTKTCAYPGGATSFTLGNPVLITGTVINSGNVQLDNVTVVDDMTGNVTTFASIEPGETVTYHASYLPTACGEVRPAPCAKDQA